MATTPSSPSTATPPAAAASAAVAGGKEAADIIKKIVNLAQDHNDLATKLVGTYKELIFNLKGTSTAAVQFKNFSKEILRDSESRESIERSIQHGIGKQKDEMIGLRLESIKYANSQDEAKKISADAQATATLLQQKNNVNWANLSNKQRQQTLADLRKEYEKRKTNISHLSETEQIAEEKRRARLDATFDRMQNMSATELQRIGYVKFSKKLIENIQKTDENRANTNQKLSELYEKQAKQKKEEIKLNEMLLTYTKMQAGVIGILEKNSFAALGPLSGMVKNSVDFAGVWKKAGKDVARAQLSMVAIQGSLSTTVKLLQSGFELFKSLDIVAEAFRKETGFTKDQTKDIRDISEQLNVEFAQLGFTLEEINASSKAITDTFGRSNSVNKDTLRDITALKVNLGIAAEDSMAVMTTFRGISKFSEDASLSVIGMTQRISENAGVSFKMVMHDIANASDDTLTSIGAYPPRLAKAAISARQMGLELNKVGSQQKRLLDYTSSITDELEASALLGKNITFMKARQLAFEGKSEESMKETLDVVRQMGDFNAMTPYQRAAVAKAAGMELKDLTKALAVDEARLEIMTNGTAEEKAKYRAQEAALKEFDKFGKLSKDVLLADRQRLIAQKEMQGVMTNLNNTLSKLKLAFANMFKPLFDVIEAITPAIEGIATGIAKASEYVKKEWGAWGSLLMAIIPAALAYGFYKFSQYMLGKAIAPIASSLKKVLSESVASASGTGGTPMSGSRGRGGRGGGGGGVRGPDVSRGVAGAAEAVRTEGRLPSTGGSKFVAFMSNIHEGLKKITPVDLIKLAVIGGIFAGMTYLIFKGMKELEGVDWATLAVASAALGGFIYTVANLGIATGLALKPIAFLSAGLLILAGGLAPFVYSFKVVGDAAKDFGEGMQKSASGFRDFIENASLSNINTAVTALNQMGAAFNKLSLNSNSAGILILESAINKINKAVSVTAINSVRFGNGMKMGVKALKDMKDIDFKSLNINISTLGKALGESSGGFFMELVNNLFGTNNLSKMEKLSNISAGLAISAEAIKTLMTSMQNFTQVDGFATAIGRLATSFVSLNTAVAALDTNKLGDVAKSTSSTSTAASTPQTSNTPNTQFDTTKLEAKIDELAKALYDRPIQLYLDSKQISSVTAKASGS